MLEEAAEYSEVVARWNAGLQTGSAGRTYREFCEYVLTEYRRRYGSPLPESGSDA
jgi:hypothetical protein